MYGVRGRLFVSNINGQILFIPTTGRFVGTSHEYSTSNGFYWSSTYKNAKTAHALQINANSVLTNNFYDRSYGFAIRPIQGGNPNRSIIPPIPEDEPKDEETQTEEEPKDKDER